MSSSSQHKASGAQGFKDYEIFCEYIRGVWACFYVYCNYFYFNVTGLRCWLIHIAVDIGTSIIQERWHSIDNYLAHLTTVEQLYLTFLDDIVVCKLDIIGTEEAVADITLRKIFAPYHPKYTVLDFDTTQKV